MVLRVLGLLGCAVALQNRAEERFERFESSRFYFTDAPAPKAPWKQLSLPHDALVVQAASSGLNNQAGAWVVANGSAFTLSTTGNLSKINADVVGHPSVGAACSSDSFVLISADAIQWIRGATHPERASKFNFGTILSVACEVDGTVWIGTIGKLLRIAQNSSEAKVVISGENITAIATTASPQQGCNPYIAVGSNLAVRHSFDCEKQTFKRHSLVGSEIDAPPTALQFVPVSQTPAANVAFELWIGHQWCLNVVRVDGLIARVDGRHGLPISNITSLSYSDGSDSSSGMGGLWVGSKVGLALLRESYMRPVMSATHATLDVALDSKVTEDRWRYFGGDRWLPGSSVVTCVYAAASEATMGAWVRTRSGLAYISSSPSTLQKQAALLTTLVSPLTRYRWVAAANLKSYGDVSAQSRTLHDGDNDGLWTGMLVASQVYRWAATGEEEARQLAWHHFAGLEFLHNVTHKAPPKLGNNAGINNAGTQEAAAPPLGFIARAAVRCGEVHQAGDHQASCPEGSSIQCGWVNSSACFAGVDTSAECCWTYKRDTSTDEVTGHFFTLALVHDYLAANDAERRRAALPICRTAKYIVDGGFVFIDPATGRLCMHAYIVLIVSELSMQYQLIPDPYDF
jgi:hypothetical protein